MCEKHAEELGLSRVKDGETEHQRTLRGQEPETTCSKEAQRAGLSEGVHGVLGTASLTLMT